jgi:ATP-binding cassette subfamily F protein uup
MSLRDFLLEGDSPAVRLAREYESLVAAPHGGPGAEALLARLTHRMEEEGGFNLERAYVSLLSELGLRDPEADMSSLSGGMVKKAAIARCLAAKADLVLLDEPTNHLDIETIEWLEAKLRTAAFAFILITHDRYFLEEACNGILEIDKRAVYSYPGDYAKFLEKRQERYSSQAQADARRVSILRDELEWLKRGPKARGGKSKSRTQRILDMVDAKPEREGSMENFSAGRARLGKKVLELEAVGKSYGKKKVIDGFSYIFSRGDRIGVIGPNGSGKTTLLNLMTGRIEPDSGSVARGENTVFAYFDQDTSGIDRNQTVLDFMRQKADRILTQDGISLTAEQFLERFLFPRSMFDHVLSKLSGGELRRLQLIRLLASGCNFLLLDEPTNDFDIDTIALLEDFLISFPGCVVTVSHDRAFLDRVTDGLFAFDGEGGVSGFVGDYSDYKESVAVGKAAATEKGPEKRAGRKTSDPGKNPLTFKEKKELEGLLSEISALEGEKSELEASFGNGTPDPAALRTNTERYQAVCLRIETASSRWLELSERE